MEKKLIVTHGRKRRRPKFETLASNLPKIQSKRLQSVQKALESVSRNQNQKTPKEMEENSGETDVRESL